MRGSEKEPGCGCPLGCVGCVGVERDRVLDEGRWMAAGRRVSRFALVVVGVVGAAVLVLTFAIVHARRPAQRAASSTVAANGDSSQPALSANGRFVAFSSRASISLPVTRTSAGTR